MSIRTRLLLYTVPLIVVPIVLLAFFSYRFLMEGFEEQARLESMQLSQIAAGRIEQKLDECYANMLLLQSEVAKEWETATRFENLLTDGSALSARLAQRFAIRHSPYAQLRIVRADGVTLLVARGLNLERSQENALSDSVFLKAVSIGALKRSPSQFPVAWKNETRVTTFAVPIFSRVLRDSLIGILFLDLDLQFVDRILAEMNGLQSGQYVLADGEGNIIADNGLPHSPRSEIRQAIKAISSLRDPMAGEVAAANVRLITRPVKEYIAFLAPVPAERWYIAIAVSASPLHAAFRRTQLVFLVILAAALTAGIVGIFFIARKITDPIGNLTTAVQRFADGDMESNIPVRSKDEIGALTSDFNKMAGDLRSLMRERQTNETLLAIGRVSASLVHDLRNPVEGLKLLSSELIKRVKREGDAFVRKDSFGEVADTIYQSAGRLSSLLTQSLDFSRLSHPEFAPTDIVALANEAVAGIRTGGIVLTKRFDEQLRAAEVDAVQIKRVLMNILMNAVEACRDNPPRTPGTVECVLRRDGATIKIEIADNGSGISPEQMENIFEPFFTTKPEGHGLGLSFARQILKNHGGELTCTSVVGKGTHFVAVIPTVNTFK